MIDFLIIGQGIAGSVLARMLEKQDKSFHIIDGKETPSASRAAAGVWNPVVMKRFTSAWFAEETVQSAKEFFAAEESFFQTRFFFENELVKILSNKTERDQMNKCWEKMLPFVEKDLALEAAPGVSAPEGILRVKTAGYMDVPVYLDLCEKYWTKSGNMIQTHFVHADLISRGGAWQWKGQEYAQVVFCEGTSGMQNPWVKKFPLENTKGQVLELDIPELKSSRILNKQIFILPQGQGRFRVGSTFEWVFDDLLPSEEAKSELMEKVRRILPHQKIDVVGQEAGGRPTTTDRRPLMGALDEAGLSVFNGLGSRGVLLVPYLSECMCRYLLGDKDAIPEEARLNRFNKRGKG